MNANSGPASATRPLLIVGLGRLSGLFFRLTRLFGLDRWLDSGLPAGGGVSVIVCGIGRIGDAFARHVGDRFFSGADAGCEGRGGEEEGECFYVSGS